MISFYQTLRKGCSCMFKRASLLSHSMLLLLFCMVAQTCVAQSDPEINGITGYLGMSMKGNWRPFNNYSPWNRTIPAGVENHLESGLIIGDMTGKGITIRLSRDYNRTLHIVNSRASKYQYHSSTNIYRFTHFNPQNCWNPDAIGNGGNGDDITDEAWPFIPGVTYPEKTEDGRMIIIDKSAGSKYTAYEKSKGTSTANLEGGYVPCTTFNIWNLGYLGCVYYRPPCSASDLGSSGNSCATCDAYWTCAGGSGSGTPLIAGLIRPEELTNALAAPLAPTDPNYNPDVPTGDGLIHHALAFAYNFNRCGPPLYPFAYRNDGPYPVTDTSKPVEGMLFQLLDADNSIENSISNAYGQVIVRTLKTYGMVLVDGGSNNDTMALYVQNMYNPNVETETNKYWWDSHYPGLYDSIIHIEAVAFRVVNTEALGARLLCGHAEACPQ